MEYDIEIVIPVSSKAPYKQRIEDFKKYGLLNIQDKKVLLTLLIGPEKLNENWPETFDVNVVSGTSPHEAAKVYSYFANYKDNSARWIAKFDDDTITDVSALINKLDKEFDHTREYYVVTELRTEKQFAEDDILRKMGYHHWFIPEFNLWHEMEGCVVSAAAMSKILSTENSVKFMKARSKIEDGYTDVALAYAARMAKIYATDTYFLTRYPLIGDLTVFGGHFAHVHDIARDKNEYCLDLLRRMLDKNMGGDSEMYPEIVNKDFVYRNWQGLHEITLRDNGIIEHGGESRIWHIKPGGHLEFLKNNGTLDAIFDNYENTNFMKGYSVNTYAHGSKSSLRKLA